MTPTESACSTALAALEMVVFDFDGVMTDDAVWVTEDGIELVRCSRADGLGVSRLRDEIPLLVLSSERNPVVTARCAKLGLRAVQGITDKGAHLAALLASEGIDPGRVAYVGNDVNDLGCIALVGLPVAVGNAHAEVLAASKLQLRAAGGHGAVRELCDLVLEARRARSALTPPA